MNKENMVKVATLLAFVLALGAMAWAHKCTPTSSSKMPGASGEINTGTERNGNTRVDLKVEDLAKPGNLTPAATAYVVWFEQSSSAPENEGELKVDNNLKGQFKTSTPWKNFDVFITAESDPLVKAPTGQTVLRSKVQM